MIFGKPNIRKKNGAYQAILPYKITEHMPWKQRSKQGFKTKIEANNWIPVAIKELEETHSVKPSSYKDHTVEELIELYLSVQEERVRPSTLYSTRIQLKGLEPVYKRKAVDLTPFDMSFIDKIDKPPTRSVVISKANALFNFCINELEIPMRNPCRKLKRNYVVPRDKFTISLEEYEKQVKPMLHTGFLKTLSSLQIKTGVRVGEGLGLTIDCISPTHIKIDKQWNILTKKLTETKNSRHRIIPITKELHKEIMDYTNFNPLTIDGRIFSKSYDSYARALKRRLGKKYPKLSSHTFRHSYATHLVSRGVDFKTVAELLGDTVEMVMKTYAQRDEETIEKVRELF